MMSNLTTAAEWAKACNNSALHTGENKQKMCVDCAESYARQQVEAFRERAAQTVIGTTWELEPEERHGIAAAIRQINL